MVEAGTVNLISSAILEYENSRNPHPNKQLAMQHYPQRSTARQLLTEDIRFRAKVLETEGVKSFDALHVASAEAGRCDYLLTTDKRLINRCKNLALKVINPVNFIVEVSDEG